MLARSAPYVRHSHVAPRPGEVEGPCAPMPAGTDRTSASSSTPYPENVTSSHGFSVREQLLRGDETWLDVDRNVLQAIENGLDLAGARRPAWK